jgi:hypothetical protein
MPNEHPPLPYVYPPMTDVYPALADRTFPLCFSALMKFCGKNTAISLVFCGVFTAIFVYLQP